jgi:hypothetical protein
MRRVGMAPRQEAAPRDGMDRPAMALVEQRDGRVDHGEAGADEQHRRIRIEIRQSTRTPGITVVACGHIVVREVADRQHRRLDIIAAAAAHLHHEPAGARLDGDGLVRHQEQVLAPAALPDFVAEKLLDVGAVEPPRNEGIRPDRCAAGARARFRGLAEPVDEVVGIVGKGAHAPGPDVQQVVGIARGISETTAELRALLDEIDARIGQEALQQLHGEERAAEAGADDRNPSLDSRCHRLLLLAVDQVRKASKAWRCPDLRLADACHAKLVICHRGFESRSAKQRAGMVWIGGLGIN